jgi:hypothetical protein
VHFDKYVKHLKFEKNKIMSKTSKIQSLIQLSQYISLFVILIGLFLGSMYAFDANLFISIPLSFGLVTLLYYFSDIIIAEKMDRKKAGIKIGVKMLWVLFIIVAIPVNILIVHSLNVELHEKTEIQNVGNQKIELLRQLKTDYTTNYEAYLKKKKSQLTTDVYQFEQGLLTIEQVASRNDVSEELINSLDRTSLIAAENSVETALISYDRKKFLRQDTMIFGNTNTYLEQKSQVINGWERFAVNNTLNELDEYLPTTYNKLNVFLQTNANSTLTYNKIIAEQKTLIAQPISLLGKHIGISSLLIVFMTNLLLLAPYLLAPSKVYNPNKKQGTKASQGGVTEH